MANKKQCGVISIDDGGHSTCVVTKDIALQFPSVKGLYGTRTLTETSEPYDFVVEYKERKYVMGTLAKYDCKYPLQMHTKSKCNDFFDLSILVSIHQYGYADNLLITSVPIAYHNDTEKAGRINRLVGAHTIKVNGVEKSFTIRDTKVAPETAVAFWLYEPNGKSRFVDLGSRTIGYATTLLDDGNVRFIDSESGTIKGKGLEALDEDYDQQSLADLICGKLASVWNENDRIHMLGGGAEDRRLVEAIQGYFPNAIVMEEPQMVNAKAMYQLGMVTYDMV